MTQFGPEGPGKSPDLREKQIQAYGDGWDEAREKLEQKYEKLENAALLAIKYELAHAEQFQRE
jgi:hypothetical protein